MREYPQNLSYEDIIDRRQVDSEMLDYRQSKLSDAGKLNPGDILVTEYTLPSWTPLFARTAALVTDSGGVLRHSAVVAGECGIPAVFGTVTAAAVIRQGQVIEVDGTAGRVRMVSQNDNMQL